ncbi:MAG TPA: malto-oligosyltrehalose synthase [Geminicoccaceae bacterium]|nr:malto-oligosyltrehalose synthase [Geminicoccus sp.]HMU51079.1 malto-oligosyltrehalose synthase [Geminicoccaceae bacterium]
MIPLTAAYRLQLRNGTRFSDAAALAPYLADLGVSHLHLSPPFTAAPGSAHGYDVVDPNALDPALGGEVAFLDLCAALQASGLGLILDIVPNHMGIGPDNAWWWDVLRHGRQSPHAGIFDIDFEGDADGKVVLPVLGRPLDEALDAGEIRVAGNGTELAFLDRRFPLADGSLEAAGADTAALLAAQHYRLVPWRDGAMSRNYRRFFDIDGLAAVRVERPEVFEATHRLVLDLLARRLVHGLRIDHVDGLADPAGYLRRLDRRAREAAGEPVPIWVEKILVGAEALPAGWPVAGTTGYEFAATATRILLAGDGLDVLDRMRRSRDPDVGEFAAVEAEARRLSLERLFPGELAALTRELAALLGRPQVAVREALEALIVAFPVYRTYLGGHEPSDADRRTLACALCKAASRVSEPAGKALDRLAVLLTGPLDGETAHLAARLQQLTGPVMAKSVEDTAFYRFPRLLALNEVGGDATARPLDDEAAHRVLAERGRAWPRSLLATSTHDTKRGEDARARLLVLAECPGQWQQAVERWTGLNAPVRPAQLHALDELSLYQAMVGAWPPGLTADDRDGLAGMRRRLGGWQRKSLREAKLRSSWLEPDEAYESAAEAFLESILDPLRSRAFLDEFAAFLARLAPAGAANGLAQTLLKLTAPGVPDIYQGGELWDFSLVDPDNRRPVDWARAADLLGSGAGIAELVADWPSGALKQRLIARVLAFRRRHAELFVGGDYLPLAIEGPAQPHAFAFRRRLGETTAITVIGRRLAGRLVDGVPRPAPDAFADSALVLPTAPEPRSYREIVGDTALTAEGGGIPLARLLGRLPVALLVQGR